MLLMKRVLQLIGPVLYIGIITRNSAYDLTKDNQQRRKICDALAVASIVANCAGVESNQNRCLGLREFREFLEDYQEEHLEDEDIIELIQVSWCLSISQSSR